MPRCPPIWIRILLTLCIAPYPVKKLNGNITKIKKEEETQNRRVGKRRTIGKE